VPIIEQKDRLDTGLSFEVVANDLSSLETTGKKMLALRKKNTI